MNGTLAQSKIYRSYAKAASKLGFPFHRYRPLDLTAAIAPANLIDTLPVIFSADDYRFRRPNGYGKPTWTALIDGRLTQPGDYLVETTLLRGQAARMFFIADQQPLLPIIAVECNEVISISRPDAPVGAGSGGLKSYGGDVTETVNVAHWPASVIAGTKGEKSTVALPDDTRMPWYVVLLPATPGYRIETDDFIETASGLRLEVSSVELTSLGWRLTAELTMT